MKYYIQLENTKVIGYSIYPIETKDTVYEVESNIDYDFVRYCDFIDGELIYNQEYELPDIINKLRAQREYECFPFINRGQLWYTLNVNTDEKLQELMDWYKAWLDVTTTLVIPEKPEWLEPKETLKTSEGC